MSFAVTFRLFQAIVFKIRLLDVGCFAAPIKRVLARAAAALFYDPMASRLKVRQSAPLGV